MKQAKALVMLTVFFVLAGVFVFLLSIQVLTRKSSPRPVFTGASSTSESCRPCHNAIYDSYIETGHFLTSSPAARKSVMGDFTEGSNVVHTPLSDLEFRMESTREGFFQTGVYTNDSTATFSKPFHVVVGSGERSQTYLFWQGNKMFQLPGMYFTPEKTWTLGPGYENWIAKWGKLPKKNLSMLYQRPIGGRCIECHASTVARVGSPMGYDFVPETLELGISCSKCHGPGTEHISFHQKNPEENKGRHIINPARLSRSQQLSSCALCHAGQGIPRTPPLSFRPGDEIKDHRFYPKEEQKKLSVHGGQVPFLEESRCFLESGTMTCSTCHNVHEDQTDRTELFSQKCLSCHVNSHIDKPSLNQGDRCTTCHMPDQKAPNLPVFHEGEPWYLSMSNHRIGIF